MPDSKPALVPMARTEDILVESLSDEVLIYDLRTHEATCLNASAALIWNLCDSQRTMGDIVDALGNAEVTEQHVADIIDRLREKNLLEAGATPAAHTAQAQVSRRSFVANAAVASLVVPAVMSTAIPAAAQVVPDFSPCNGNAQCNNPPSSNDRFCCSYNTAQGNAKCCLPESFNSCPGTSNNVFENCDGFVPPEE